MKIFWLGWIWVTMAIYPIYNSFKSDVNGYRTKIFDDRDGALH